MEKTDLIDQYFAIVSQEDLCRSPGNLRHYMHYLFKDITFSGKTMLDIGGGTGLYSFYVGCRGASQVVCLEPEAEGSSAGTMERFQRLSTLLGQNQVNLYPIRFQDFEPGNMTFDIILLHNSINHLDETACIRLQRDSQALETYKRIFQRLGNMANNEAKLIITDCSRYNFFALCRCRNPFIPNIEWHKHQSPNCWAKLLSDVGFRNPEIRWTSFNSLRSTGRLLLGNKVAAFFLHSHFCLTMEK